MVEGARLESVYTGNRIVGSNPTPSAIISFATVYRRFLWTWMPQVLRAFEAKAVDCRSGIAPQILSH